MGCARVVLALAFLVACACTGTTGFELVHFNAAAVGPADGKLGYEFVNDRGFHIALRTAKIHIGAVYLDQSLPTSGSAETACTLPGTYTAEVRQGLDADMLSPIAQPFPGRAEGTTLPAHVAEVWLTGGDVNAAEDPTVILAVSGSADKDGLSYPFSGNISIGRHRFSGAVASALPGANPICKQRIVSPIVTSITTDREGGLLLLHLDPKPLFTNVDFSALHKFSDDPPAFGFSDSSDDQPSLNLYENLRSVGSVYRFEWIPP